MVSALTKKVKKGTVKMAEDVGSFSLVHLPIVKADAQRLGFMEMIDRALPGGGTIPPQGLFLSARALDTMSLTSRINVDVL